MREIRAQVGQVAKTSVPVLLLGESGTGKEMIARLIHKLSPRAHRRLLKVNCAALPSELLESELFGYEAGAFTGASRSRAGKFEACNNGTIMLDEIAEMPPGPQAKLLHVLQDGEFLRLGSPRPIRVDVRILAATNVNIKGAMETKTLREDLYYRLSAFTITLPPLRERKEDIPLLVRHLTSFLAQRYGLAPLPVTPSILETCQRHSWPGNIRELENFVKHYLIVGDEEKALCQLEAPSNGHATRVPPPPGTEGRPPGDLKSLIRGLKKEAEVHAILRALELANGSRKEAARLLNISVRALLYKIRDYAIDRPISR